MNMFRSPSPEPAAVDEVGTGVPDDLIPLSHLQLDLPEPAEGWPNYLGRRGIAFVPDRLGRDAVTFGDAKRLLDEARAEQLRQRRVRAQQEAEAVEASRRFHASLPPGLPAGAIPDGVTYGDLVRQAAKDARPRRRSPLEESLSGSTLTYHELPRGDDS